MAVTSKPGLGMNSWIGFGSESTYGTLVNPTEYLEIESETIMKEVKRITALSILRRGTVDNKIVPGEISVMGDVTFPVQYDGWLLLAQQAFGTVVNSQPDVTNAPTAWKHHFTIADVLPAALSFEVFRDTTQFTTEPNKSFKYSGCKVSKLDFACKVGEVLKGVVGIIGQNEARGAVSTLTPTFSTENYAIFTQGIVRYNNNDLEVDNFTLSLNNGLAARYKLGSALTREPVPDVKIIANGSFDCEFQDWNEYDDFVNTTERSLTATFTGSSLGGLINKQILLTCNQIIIDKVTLSLNKPGRILMTIAFSCYRNSTATQNEIVMDIINTNSSV